MHTAAFEFVRRVAQSLPPLARVVEFGSRVRNGSVREIFTDAAGPSAGGLYLGIDLEGGPGVDLVADAADWRTAEPLDAVVCCEVLEHTPRAVELCRSARLALRPGGVLILTCATTPRTPHGSAGGLLRAGEFYRNVGVADLLVWLAEAGFAPVLLDPTAPSGDLYALAWVAR